MPRDVVRLHASASFRTIFQAVTNRIVMRLILSLLISAVGALAAVKQLQIG